MDVILKKDVDNLGFKDDVVAVKNGYGRNYLIPHGYAELATPSARKVLFLTVESTSQIAPTGAEIPLASSVNPTTRTSLPLFLGAHGFCNLIKEPTFLLNRSMKWLFMYSNFLT